jgi:WD40 repeat protein
MTKEAHPDCVTSCCKRFYLVYSVNYSPDGQCLASASEDSSIKIWSESFSLARLITSYSRLHQSPQSLKEDIERAFAVMRVQETDQIVKQTIASSSRIREMAATLKQDWEKSKTDVEM